MEWTAATRDVRIEEVTEYLFDKLVLDEERQSFLPLNYYKVSIWRMDWIVRQYWVQVIAVELEKMAQDWDVHLSWNTSNLQEDTGRCLVSLVVHWEQSYEEATQINNV